MDTGPPLDPGGRTRTGASGFRTFLWVLLACAAALVVTCGGAAYLALRNPAVRELLDSARQSAEGPGAIALRAAGCTQAVVVDLAAARGALESLLGEQNARDAAVLPLVLVSCQVSGDADAPSCERVATVYREASELALEPSRRFVTQVARGLSRKPECQEVYGPTGVHLGTLEEFIQERLEAPG